MPRLLAIVIPTLLGIHAGIATAAPLEPAEKPHATLNIDTSAPSKAVSPMLFGGFIEHFQDQIYGGLYEPGSPLADVRGFRKDVIAAMKELKKPHTAAPALEWVAAMQALAAKRPENFNRVVKPEEKQLLEAVLESALGVQRKKPATKKVATKKAAAKKTATKKATTKKPFKLPPSPYKEFL